MNECSETSNNEKRHEPATVATTQPKITMSGGFWFDVQQDLQRHTPAARGSFRRILVCLATILLSSGFHAMVLHRIGFKLFQLHLRPLAFVTEKVIYHLYHCCIPSSAVIGPGVWLPHCLGIVIAKDAVVGAGVTIHQHVQLLRGAAFRPPRIGDGVWLSPASQVVGINIGEDTFVAAGAVVVKNCPPRQFAAGVPANFKPKELNGV